uniref:Phytosulfokine n=1 Tax=Nelumbo nucifera TaxID=4432 RepID=A0A822YJ95_NELNU|nr:TPA_asm: hypothetical protein HUJ06_010442 [Nelumbo nucifera]
MKTTEVLVALLLTLVLASVATTARPPLTSASKTTTTSSESDQRAPSSSITPVTSSLETSIKYAECVSMEDKECERRMLMEADDHTDYIYTQDIKSP